jgi:hypothetical protein
MGGKSNKARRKQERLRQRRSGQRRSGEPGKREVCALYRNPPEGAFYESWVDCGSLKKTVMWADAAMQDQRAADDPDVHDLARRMPYLLRCPARRDRCRAGHSVCVMLTVYAHGISGCDQIASQQVE